MGHYKFNSGFNIKRFLIIVSILLLISYGIFNARNLLLGPSVEIFNPPRPETETDKNILIIKGKTKNVVYLSLNERPIFIDTEGLFEEKLLLSPGSNIIEIKGKDRFKKEIRNTIKVYYKQDASNGGTLLEN